MSTPYKIGQPRFLSEDEVVTLHRATIDGFGGTSGLLDAGKLSSALAQPRQGFGRDYVHAFPFEMAGAYAFHLAMNHAFVDGNKRIAFSAMGAFLFLNGWELDLPGEEGAMIILELIEQHRDKAWLTGVIASKAKPRPSWELRDFFRAVKFEHLDSFLRSYDASNTEERIATLSEAAEIFPMLDPLLHEVAVSIEKKDAEATNEWFGRASLIFAMYRIAEDMGYEW